MLLERKGKERRGKKKQGKTTNKKSRRERKIESIGLGDINLAILHEAVSGVVKT